jgi:hypothetical protein
VWIGGCTSTSSTHSPRNTTCWTHNQKLQHQKQIEARQLLMW